MSAAATVWELLRREEGQAIDEWEGRLLASAAYNAGRYAGSSAARIKMFCPSGVGG